MGYLGYAFTSLSKQQLHERRLALDFYGLLAQSSILVPLLLLQLYYVTSWIFHRLEPDDREERPSSPYLKADLDGKRATWMRRAVISIAKVRWWFGDEVAPEWGRNGEWMGGVLWGAWLGFCCVKGTGDDYMHLTKRFGIVAASQLPLHYLLAMKSTYSPLQLLTSTSHEQLNAAHRVLGQLIRILFTLHATFYLNFFALNGLLAKRIKDRDVILGLLAFSAITAMSTAAIGRLRAWNYRVFYVVHVVSAVVFLPIAFFHVRHVRVYVWETAAIYVANVVLRFLDTKTYQGTLSLVPGTSLVQVSMPSKSDKRRFKSGQHIYLSLPAGQYKSTVPNYFLHNPFTVASLPNEDGLVKIVARTLGGNTKNLAALARSMDMDREGKPKSIPLKIEGPYGISTHFIDLARFDKILLVAGGVGATFTIPIWRDIIMAKQRDESLRSLNVHLVWAVRKLPETGWALPLPESSDQYSEVEIFVTGRPSTAQREGGEESIELEEREALVRGDDEKILAAQGAVVVHRRPDFSDIVDALFSGHAGRVAVFVCGPSGMSRQLRQEVRRQVWRGKQVFWHAEAFGY